MFPKNKNFSKNFSGIFREKKKARGKPGLKKRKASDFNPTPKYIWENRSQRGERHIRRDLDRAVGHDEVFRVDYHRSAYPFAVYPAKSVE